MATKVSTTLTHATGPRAVDEIATALHASLGDAAPVLVMAFASTQQPLSDLAPALTERFPTATVLGASTAGEFNERRDAKSAVAAIAVAGDYVVHAAMGKDLRANPEGAVKAALGALPSHVAGYEHRTAVLLLDPLAGNGEEATLLLAAELGPEQPIVGGAAGDDLKMATTFVSCGGQVASDALVVARIHSKHPLGIGVCHGHKPLSGPLRVTRAHGATVEEIDGRPAWTVWLEKTRQHAAARGIDVDKLTPESEGGYLLQYEAGLAAGDSFKIRAPLSRSGNAINFACGIAEGAVIRITQSDGPAQVASAREAAHRARERLGGRPAAGAIVFDCICRNLILGKDFDGAVKGIVAELGNIPLAGFETYGEIAMDAGDMSGFHNTTSVVLAFPV